MPQIKVVESIIVINHVIRKLNRLLIHLFSRKHVRKTVCGLGEMVGKIKCFACRESNDPK